MRIKKENLIYRPRRSFAYKDMTLIDMNIDRHETGANTTESFIKSFLCPPELSVGIKNQIL